MATSDFTTGSESHPKPPPVPVHREAEAVEAAPPIIAQAATAGGRAAWKRWAVWVGSATAMAVLALGLKSWLAPAPEPRRAEPRIHAQVSTPPSPAPAPTTLDPGLEAQPPAGAGREPRPRPAADAPVMATCLLAVVDDFIVDVFQNGEKVADARRRLEAEIFGATVERIELTLREGDWLVFNVVNNRLRWGGAYYFAVAGFDARGGVRFTTELQSGRWSVCDQPGEAPQFIADPDHLANNLARPVETRWSRGDDNVRERVRNWSGEPLWGTNRNTWIKFLARP